jgi:hypothetical protein
MLSRLHSSEITLVQSIGTVALKIPILAATIISILSIWSVLLRLSDVRR